MDNYNLFVYGTLKRGFSNNRLLAHQKFLGSAITCSPKVMETAGIPYVYDFPQYYIGDKLMSGSCIEGELWEVDQRAFTKIDLLEGHPRWYRRKLTNVQLHHGTSAQAWLYYMTPRKTIEGLPAFQHGTIISSTFTQIKYAS